MDLLKEIITKLQKFDKLKNQDFVKILDDSLINKIQAEIPTDEQL